MRLLREGKSRQEVAETIGTTAESVRRWDQAAKQGQPRAVPKLWLADKWQLDLPFWCYAELGLRRLVGSLKNDELVPGGPGTETQTAWFGMGLAGFRPCHILVLSEDVNVSDNHLCAGKEP